MHSDPLFLGTRSEVQVAADAVWSLFHFELVPTNPTTVRQAADAAGIPISALREAEGRRRARIYMKPRADYRTQTPEPAQTPAPAPAAAAAPPAPTAAAPVTTRASRWSSAEARERHRDGARRGAAAAAAKKSRQPKPHENEMECSSCSTWKPVDQFSKRSDRPDKRWTVCIDCRRAKQRERYLHVAKRDALNAARIQFTWNEEDAELGITCSDCGKPLVAGDLVRGDAELGHVNCQSEPS